MNVLHAIPHEAPQAGEISSILPDLLDTLREHGVNGDMVTPATPAGDLRDKVADADLIHIHALFGPLVPKVVAHARAAEKPYVLSPYAALSANPKRGLSWREKLALRFSVGKALRAAAGLIAVDDHEAAYLKSLGYRNVTTARPAINCDEKKGSGTFCAQGPKSASHKRCLTPFSALADRRLMLYLGPIVHPTEGLAPMFKAAGQLADDLEDWHVVLAGTVRGKWRPLIEAALRRQRLADRVTIVESPDPSCQRQLLARADLLICPVLRDAAPVAVAQALAAGCPVIASQTLHLPEIADADAGRVVHPSRRGIFPALEELTAASSQTLTDMGARAANLARKLFDVDKNALRLAEIYRSA